MTVLITVVGVFFTTNSGYDVWRYVTKKVHMSASGSDSKVHGPASVFDSTMAMSKYGSGSYPYSSKSNWYLRNRAPTYVAYINTVNTLFPNVSLTPSWSTLCELAEIVIIIIIITTIITIILIIIIHLRLCELAEIVCDRV